MNTRLVREYQGHAPHTEAWFGKVDLAPGRAFWFRYSILDGIVCEASTWGVLFDNDAVAATGREVSSLEFLSEDKHNGVVFNAECGRLGPDSAEGRAGPLKWKLRWYLSDRRSSYLPEALTRRGVAGLTYEGDLLDIRVSGVLQHGDSILRFDGAPGMIGHLHGRHLAVNRWAWAHCNCFDLKDNAVFEAFSFNLNVLGGGLRPFSAGILYLDEQCYTFRSVSRALLSRSRFDRDRWRFTLKEQGCVLKGTLTTRRSQQALLEYMDTDGSRMWCYNTALSTLALELRDDTGRVRRLTSTGRAAYDFVVRDSPNEHVDLA